MPASTSPTEFTMHGSRVAMVNGLPHIEEQVKGIERAIGENPGLAFDLARTVVESACRTILTERKVPFVPGDDLPALFRAVTDCLPLLPAVASGEAEARKSLKQTLNGLNTALQGICELRNRYGFASHGSDGPHPGMEGAQAMLAAQAADAIVGFLHRVHCQGRGSTPSARLEYEDNEAFNTYVDGANEAVRIFALEYRPSEVLFNVDQEAYRDLLSGFVPERTDSESELTDATAGVGS